MPDSPQVGAPPLTPLKAGKMGSLFCFDCPQPPHPPPWLQWPLQMWEESIEYREVACSRTIYFSTSTSLQTSCGFVVLFFFKGRRLQGGGRCGGREGLLESPTLSRRGGHW